MAHSPAPKPRGDRAFRPAGKFPRKITTATCKTAHAYQTLSSRSRRRSRRPRVSVLYRRFRMFRLGFNTAKRRAEEGDAAVKPKIQNPHVEKNYQDPNLLKYLRRCEENNKNWTKENAKLKMERGVLQKHLEDIYHAELDLYEISVKLESFQRKYAQAVVHMEKHGVATTSFTQFLPAYKRIANDHPGVRRVATDLTLPPRTYSTLRRYVKYEPNMDLEPLNEDGSLIPAAEPAARAASRSLYGGSIQQKNVEGKRHCRRNTLVPGELDRVIRPLRIETLPEQKEEDVEDTTQVPEDNIRSTPKKDVDNSTDQLTPVKSKDKSVVKMESINQLKIPVSKSPEISMPVELVQELFGNDHESDTEEEKKENIRTIPVESASNKKRSFDASNKIEIRTPGTDRRPTGVCQSPRLSVGARLSLRMSMGDNNDPKTNSSDDEEEISEAKSDVSLASLMSILSNEVATGGGTDREYTDEEEDVTVSSFNSLALDESSGDASSTLSQRSGRPQRAARAKVSSMKEPSLNTKLRRPKDVPALKTPSRSRRTGSRKGTAKKAASELRSKSTGTDE